MCHRLSVEQDGYFQSGRRHEEQRVEQRRVYAEACLPPHPSCHAGELQQVCSPDRDGELQTFPHVLCDARDTFLSDLRDSVQEVIDHPEWFEDGMAPIYGMAATMPDRSLVSELLTNYTDALLEP